MSQNNYQFFGSKTNGVINLPTPSGSKIITMQPVYKPTLVVNNQNELDSLLQKSFWQKETDNLIPSNSTIQNMIQDFWPQSNMYQTNMYQTDNYQYVEPTSNHQITNGQNFEEYNTYNNIGENNIVINDNTTIQPNQDYNISLKSNKNQNYSNQNYPIQNYSNQNYPTQNYSSQNVNYNQNIQLKSIPNNNNVTNNIDTININILEQKKIDDNISKIEQQKIEDEIKPKHIETNQSNINLVKTNISNDDEIPTPVVIEGEPLKFSGVQSKIGNSSIVKSSINEGDIVKISKHESINEDNMLSKYQNTNNLIQNLSIEESKMINNPSNSSKINHTQMKNNNNNQIYQSLPNPIINESQMNPIPETNEVRITSISTKKSKIHNKSLSPVQDLKTDKSNKNKIIEKSNNKSIDKNTGNIKKNEPYIPSNNKLSDYF